MEKEKSGLQSCNIQMSVLHTHTHTHTHTHKLQGIQKTVKNDPFKGTK